MNSSVGWQPTCPPSKRCATQHIPRARRAVSIDALPLHRTDKRAPLANTSAQFLSARNVHPSQPERLVFARSPLNKGFRAHGPNDAKDLATVLEIEARPAMNTN